MVFVSSWFGTTDGATQGSGSNTTAVTKIQVYDDGTYIYGIKVFYSSGSTMLGISTAGTKKTLNPTHIIKIEALVIANELRGLKFHQPTGSPWGIGYLTGTFSTVYDNASNDLVDMQASAKQGVTPAFLCAAKFYYTGVALSRISSHVDEYSLLSVGVLLQSFVLAKSYIEVGKLRHELAIKAPSCDPPPGTDPIKTQLWYRTFRAQENTKEAFLFFVPVAAIAAIFGHRAFGKWAPHAVGVFTLAGAFFRYKYLKAYIEDAEKRGKPFAYNMMFSVRPVAFLAVVSCGYVAGKHLVKCLRCCESKTKNEEAKEEEEEEEQ